jgi:hypothetical protein
MLRYRASLLAIVAVSCLGGAAFAQSQTPPAAAPAPAAAPSSPSTSVSAPAPAVAPSSPSSSVSATASATTEDVSKWTRKQWNAAKAKWTQEKDKWAGCRKQAGAQKLAGRASWQFLYDCMMKS